MSPAFVLSMQFRVATDIHVIKYVCSFAFVVNRRLLFWLFFPNIDQNGRVERNKHDTKENVPSSNLEKTSEG